MLADSSSTSTLPALTESAAPVLDQRFAATFGARIILADDNADMRAYVGDCWRRSMRSRPSPTATRHSRRHAGNGRT